MPWGLGKNTLVRGQMVGSNDALVLGQDQNIGSWTIDDVFVLGQDIIGAWRNGL